MAGTTTPPAVGMEEYVEPTWGSKLAYVWRLLWRDKGGLLGMILFLLMVITAVFAPIIAPHDPLEQNLRDSKLPPAWYEGGNWDYPLGTDRLGKDIFSRIVYGTRVSLTVAVFGVLIAGGLGLLAGLVAGFMGGKVDGAIMAGVNLWLAIP
ncbi:MAG: hypothetical protein KC423_29365, partial [Anaerolineales bacterium]|nr:hypothetical protein [Anaerolineales bacterium]